MKQNVIKARIKKSGGFVEKWFKYLMITPMTIILAGVAMYPFAFAVKLSFTNAKTMNIRNPDFAGLKNFASILTAGLFWKSTLLTIIYVVGALSLEIVLGLYLAILADKALRGQKWYVSLLITPMLISTVLSGIIFRLELNPQFGVITHYLKFLGGPENLLDMIHLVEEALGEEAQKEMLPMQPGDIPASFADIERAKQKLGFEPKTNMQEGIIKFVEWYKDYIK